MNGLRSVKIKEISSLVARGISPRYTETDGFTVLNQKCIRNNKITFDLARNFSKNQKMKNGCWLQSGDILINSTGTGTLGRSAIYRDSKNRVSFDSHITLVRIERNDIDPFFVGYQIELLENTIENLAGGSTGQTELSRKDVLNFDLVLPDYDYQKRVSSLIIGIESKIDVNNRIIKTYSKFLYELFNEWFLRKRSTYYVKVSDDTTVQNDWKTIPLSDIAIINHKSLSKRTAPEEIYYVDISSVSSGHIDNVTFIKTSEAPGRAKRIISDGDTLFATVRPENRSFAYISNPPKNMIASTGFAVLSSKSKEFAEFIYFHASSDRFIEEMSIKAKGSAYPQIGFSEIEKFQVQIPIGDSRLITKFHEIAHPVMKKIDSLSRSNLQLRKIRDNILPRLVGCKF